MRNEIEKDVIVTLTEKRSRFITRLYRINSKEQIIASLKETENLEKGATHNCYAWRLWEAGKITEGRSDDGEPSGTAGMPMLGVLSGAGLLNILVIVTRYFGGVKLGTGGLVRVYSRCVKEALNQVKISPFVVQKHFILTFPISETAHVNYILNKMELFPVKRDFSDPLAPVYHFEFSDEKKEELAAFCPNWKLEQK